MGFFSGVKDTFKKSEAAVLVQKLLEQQVAQGNIQFDPAPLANKLVSSIWNDKPDIFSGKFGQRPHKITTAALALLLAIETQPADFRNPAFLLSLGHLLSELEINGRLYPLNTMDEELLQGAKRAF